MSLIHVCVLQKLYFPNLIKFKNVHVDRRAGPRRGCSYRHSFYSLLLAVSETHGEKK